MKHCQGARELLSVCISFSPLKNTITHLLRPDMAPEVAVGQQYDQSADIYSFSLIIFEMLFGRIDLFALPGCLSISSLLFLFLLLFSPNFTNTPVGTAGLIALSNALRPRFPEGAGAKCSFHMKEMIQKGWHLLPIERPSGEEFLQSILQEFSSIEDDGRNGRSRRSFTIGERGSQSQHEGSELARRCRCEQEPRRRAATKAEDLEMLEELVALLQRPATGMRHLTSKPDSSTEEAVIIIQAEEKRRCHEVEEKEIIVDSHYDQSGTITCLASIKAPSSLKSLISWSGIVAGTSRGWLLFWSAKVYNPSSSL